MLCIGFLVAGRIIDKLGTKIGYALATALWSVAAVAHALATSATGFIVARGALGFTEAGNFPAAIKTVQNGSQKKKEHWLQVYLIPGLISVPSLRR